MERVAFLLERTGQRLGCLLNPECLVLRRTAGIRPRRTPSGPLTGAGLRDDPLLFTGGGVTELELDLLFDVSLAGSSVVTEDVRDLTGPLWELAENTPGDAGALRPPLVHFVWGKSWNIPGVVTAVAERLESFTAQGVPRRSWLRMRLQRVDIPIPEAPAAPPAPLVEEGFPAPALQTPLEEDVSLYEMIGGGEGPEGGPGGDRLDEIAARYFGDPSYWRLLASFNNIDDPVHLPPATLLAIPRLSPGLEKRP